MDSEYPAMTSVMTADLCDEFGDAMRVADAVFESYGQVRRFSGRIATLRVYEDNTLVREALESPGDGRVLVVDGGGSRRCALLGGNLAALARDNGWSGIVVYGSVRDRPELAEVPVGVLALQTMPRKSRKTGLGEQNVDVVFAGVMFRPGEYLCADEDGLVVSAAALPNNAS